MKHQREGRRLSSLYYLAIGGWTWINRTRPFLISSFHNRVFLPSRWIHLMCFSSTRWKCICVKKNYLHSTFNKMWVQLTTSGLDVSARESAHTVLSLRRGSGGAGCLQGHADVLEAVVMRAHTSVHTCSVFCSVFIWDGEGSGARRAPGRDQWQRLQTVTGCKLEYFTRSSLYIVHCLCLNCKHVMHHVCLRSAVWHFVKMLFQANN